LIKTLCDSVCANFPSNWWWELLHFKSPKFPLILMI
jgi:hypothetical protein